MLDWRKADGGWKEVSCRVALLRMHEDGWLTLPPSRANNHNGRRTPPRTPAAEPQPQQEFCLPQPGRLRFELVTRERSALWNEYIDRYHYLGYTPLVGAQLRYFPRSRLQLAAAGADSRRAAAVGYDRRAAVVADFRFVVARIAFRSTLRTLAPRPGPAMFRSYHAGSLRPDRCGLPVGPDVFSDPGDRLPCRVPCRSQSFRERRSLSKVSLPLQG